MEDNIADALKMAGSVLLFVIGLSIAFVSFSQTRESIDIILSYSDRESLSIENDSKFYYLSDDNDTNRYVGIETIIPAVYRTYKENYKIVFDFNDNYYLFEDKYGNKVKTLDLAKQSIGSDLASRQFLNGIIYGKFDYDGSGKTKADYEEHFDIKVNSEMPLYKYLQNKSNIKEFLGTYYTDDLNGTNEEVNDINKTEKRVITYTDK